MTSKIIKIAAVAIACAGIGMSYSVVRAQSAVPLGMGRRVYKSASDARQRGL